MSLVSIFFPVSVPRFGGVGGRWSWPWSECLYFNCIVQWLWSSGRLSAFDYTMLLFVLFFLSTPFLFWRRGWPSHTPTLKWYVSENDNRISPSSRYYALMKFRQFMQDMQGIPPCLHFTGRTLLVPETLAMVWMFSWKGGLLLLLTW